MLSNLYFVRAVDLPERGENGNLQIEIGEFVRTYRTETRVPKCSGFGHLLNGFVKRSGSLNQSYAPTQHPLFVHAYEGPSFFPEFVADRRESRNRLTASLVFDHGSGDSMKFRAFFFAEPKIHTNVFLFW
jgi:hypothetical protein